MYEYNTKIERVIDGDTADVFIDLGFEVWHHQRLRFAGIDAAEHNTAFGAATKDYLKKTLEGQNVRIQVSKPDKYGRYLATIFLNSDISINDQMIKNGLAKPYNGDSKSGLWTPEELAKTTVDATLI
jgi:endonuclease YncB( thermonuclease family)